MSLTTLDPEPPIGAMVMDRRGGRWWRHPKDFWTQSMRRDAGHLTWEQLTSEGPVEVITWGSRPRD